MNAIIFGATGQDGFYLTNLLRENKIDVIPVARKGAEIVGDVADYHFVHNLLRIYRPGFIFHLAANSTTRHDAVFENHSTITTGTLNILEAARELVADGKIFLSGSGLQFFNSGAPINETSPFNPLSPYAVSRIQSVYAGRYYRTLGLQVYVGYFFNHESPLRSERHVSKMITNAVCRIAKGSYEFIEIGNLSTRKEWTFAGDIMNAVWNLVNQDTVFEAVIGSGLAYSIEEFIISCFNRIGKDWHNYVRQIEGFVSEYQILVSDPTLIKQLGWEPKITLDQLAQMMLSYNQGICDAK
jgi:GDPmannose 4,6-dehydratase